jgi:hypothetical protein
MKHKTVGLMSIATALASLAAAAQAGTPPVTSPEENTATTNEQAGAIKIIPNTIFTAGQDLLGLLITQNADGTIVAQHASHYSHSSHASHASHASSRY